MMTGPKNDESTSTVLKAGPLPWTLALIAPVVPVLMLAESWGKFQATVSDFPEYYAASWLCLNGQAIDLYQLERLGAAQHQLFPDLAREVVPFLLTPPAVLIVAPLSFLPPDLAIVAWHLFMGVMLLLSVFILAKMFRFSKKAVLYTIAVFSVSGAMFECLKLGQIAPLLLLAYSVGLFCEFSGRPVLSGLSYSLLLVKPQFLLPVLVAGMAGKSYRCLVALVLSAFLLGAASCLVLGIDGWQHYIELAGTALARPELVATGINATVRGQLLRFWGSESLIVEPLFWLLWSLAILSLYLGLRGRRPEDAILFSMPVAFLLAPYAQSYDLILLLPSIMCFVKCELHRSLPSWIMLPYIVACLVLLLPFHSFYHYGYLLPGGAVNLVFFLVLAYVVIILVGERLIAASDARAG
ncbi:MAG: DUF2029 domain-containing protein [Candidatus Melainabacteria bacterium]|nr:DUF2029 domain-containing protein [Candidatus Melainabacteria bacterium]